jgi:Flp pilus assembly protein TadB
MPEAAAGKESNCLSCGWRLRVPSTTERTALVDLLDQQDPASEETPDTSSPLDEWRETLLSARVVRVAVVVVLALVVAGYVAWLGIRLLAVVLLVLAAGVGIVVWRAGGENPR